MSQYFNRAYQYLTNVSRDTPRGKRRTHPSLSPEQKAALESIVLDTEGVDWVGKTEGYLAKVYNDRKGQRGKKAGETDFGRKCGYKHCYPPLANGKVGHPTVGYGKLLLSKEIAAGIWTPFLKNGPASMTKPQAKKILKLGIEKHLRRFIHKLTRVPTQNQLTALTSFVFNTGGNQKRFIPILTAFNAGNDAEVARLLRIYNGTTRLKHGHVMRRFNEAELYTKGDYRHPYRNIPKSAIAGFQSSGTGASGHAMPQKKKGPPVFLLGDSNTAPHRRFWKAWIAKQFGRGTRVVDKSKGGNTLGDVLKKMEKVDAGGKAAAGLIIGSVGGNNATWMGKKNQEWIEKTLSPNGSYYRKHVAPFMARLKELQDKGTKIIFYGLPFGRGKGKECKNNTPLARQRMDELLAFGAAQYKVPYNSIFQETKAVKGDGCGVHYGKGQYAAYRDALRSKNPSVAPLAEEEKAYAQSVVGGKKVNIVAPSSSGRWLGPYKYIQAAGLSLAMVYKQLEKVYGPSWAQDLLPKHGADRVFGPEHFAAVVAMAKKTNNKKLLSMLMQRNSFQDPVIAKAETKAIQNAIKAEPKATSTGTVMPVAGILQRKKKAAAAKASAPKAAPVKPANFEQVVHQAKPNDQFLLNFNKDVTWGFGLKAFKVGKTYSGSKVLPNGEVLVKTELGSRELTKKDFISQVKSKGEPCDILNCDTSYIIRPSVGKKSFTAFLKNPSFEGEKKAIAENKKKCKIRIVLNC